MQNSMIAVAPMSMLTAHRLSCVCSTFHLDFLNGFGSYYQNVTNILVRVSYVHPTSQQSNTEHALLISAHYDSSLRTVAASVREPALSIKLGYSQCSLHCCRSYTLGMAQDDLANICVMLDLVRALSHSPPLQHAVVFNFNGAEETILQAAHGFITQVLKRNERNCNRVAALLPAAC